MEIFMSYIIQSQNCFSIINLRNQYHDADVCCDKVKVTASKVKIQGLKQKKTDTVHANLKYS